MFPDVGQCSFPLHTLSSIATTAAAAAAAASVPNIIEREVSAGLLDPLLSRYEQELLSCVYYRLIAYGARVTTHLTNTVTHIILLSPDIMTCFHTRFTRIQVSLLFNLIDCICNDVIVM